MKRFIIVLLLIFISYLYCDAVGNTDVYVFSSLDNRNGLSENNVKTILQDSWGLMWFGTKNGLNRYDGCNVKHYNVYDENRKVGNNNVSALYEDSRKQIWVGTDKGVFIFNPYMESFSFFEMKDLGGKQINNWIAQIVGDKNGNIWIISPTEGTFRYNLNTKKMKVYHVRPGISGDVGNAQCVCVRKNGEVWFGSDCDGLIRYDSNNDRLVKVGPRKRSPSNIMALCDYGDFLCLGEHEGRLMKYNPHSQILEEINAPDVHYKLIRALLFDGERLYVGTQAGLYVVDETHRHTTCVRQTPGQPYGLVDDFVYSLYEDRNKGLWIGTMYGGVNYFSRNGISFNNFIPMNTPGALSSKHVGEMVCDNLGRVWIASNEGSINLFNPTTKLFTQIPLLKVKGGHNRLSLMVNGNDVWSGIFMNGLDIINTHTFSIKHYTPKQLGLDDEGSVFALFKDRRGVVWLGTGHGAYVKKKGAMSFLKLKEVGNYYIHDFCEDKQGNVWIATMGNGVIRYSSRNRRCTLFTADGKQGSIGSNSISSMTVDHKGRVWFSTDRGGISFFDHHNNRFTSYSKKDGLPDDVAYKILEDHGGNLWFGTNQGLVRFNPATHDIKVYRNTNGLVGNQYCYKSAIALPGGKFLFGGVSGLVEFNPSLADFPRSNYRVLITNIRVNNKELLPKKGGIIEQNILYLKKIVLPHDVTNIAFDISTLNYSGTENDLYEYMLEGVDKNWIKTTSTQGIFYSQLQPGHYKLKVRLIGNNNVTTSLEMVVKHPWWSTIIAKIVYLFLSLSILWCIYHRLHLKQMRKIYLREKQYKEAKEKELMQSKIDFFTDITHEIRTPLTLINGAVENMKEAGDNNKTLNKNISAIEKNCQRLLKLANQLLDFRKVENHTMKLHFTTIDVCHLVKGIVERFEPAITSMHKTIKINTNSTIIMADIDIEAFTKIMSNLINNARKYSDKYIIVEVLQNKNNFIVFVSNDGPRIPNDKASDIFKPFYQLDRTHQIPGSGIGLPLALSLSQLHGGTLYLDTTTINNKFVLTMPLKHHQKAQIENSNTKETGELTIIEESNTNYNKIESKNKEAIILLVEDNKEVLQMIVEKMQNYYLILAASNGKEALDVVKKQHVDLVVSDIMMPVMDGLQFTKKLKADIDINHIPVVLLTAKNTFEDHLEGVKCGADAYIEKPFSFVFLFAQIESLLNNRKLERESFMRKPYLPVRSAMMSKPEEAFIKKMTNVIMIHLREPEFNVEALASEMCMSRSSLHRKVKDVLHMSPIEFIRLIRLKKAAELIKEQNYRISEVCEMVGFTSASYFIKLFQKQFGKTPKEFANEK